MIRASLAAAAALVGVAHAEVMDSTAKYPEGPLWHGAALYVAEMGADTVYAHARGRKAVFWTDAGCGPTSIAPYDEGFLVLCHMAREVVSVSTQGAEKRRWRVDDKGVRLRNPNDAYADGRGGVFFSDPGVFSIETRPHGALMHLSASGVLRSVVAGLHYPNGVYVDEQEGALYVGEHLRRRVLRYRIAADGSLGEMEVFADLNRLTRKRGTYPEAGPDGLERGPDGDLYVCLYGEGRVLRLSRSGKIVASIALPTPYLTNIAFGPDGAAYLTGAYDNLTRPFPGAVMRLSPAQVTGRR